jgi:hypothetical protein
VIAVALVVAVSLIYVVWRAFPFSPIERRRWAGAWRLAIVIAAVRIGVFASGALLMRHADWRQGVGYVFVLVGLPEIHAAKMLRSNPAAWLAACCALLAATSLVWATLFRLPRRRAMAEAHQRRNT